MEFLQQADFRVVDIPCQCCDSPIEQGQAVYFDVDGERDADGQDITRVTAMHGWCFTFVERAKAVERAAALIEAAQNVRASGSLGGAHDALMVKARLAHGRVMEMVA